MKKNMAKILKCASTAQWLAIACLAGAAASPAQAQATFYGSDACKELIHQGQELEAQSKANEALARFKAAAKQCPNASSPLSSLAHLFFDASGRTDPKYVDTYRQQAASYARAALAIEPKDPVALEILRGLTTARDAGPDHKPAPEAAQALAEAEKLFAARKYDDAYSAYMAVQKLDADWAAPWVFAGDCLFAQHKISEAETHYRKGTEVDPYFVQGWRFLADALAQQGKLEDARRALLGAITAQPNYMPAWENLSSLADHSGKPMTALKFKPKAFYVKDKNTGKSNINLDQTLASQEDGTDMAIWLAYATAKIVSTEKPQAGETKSAFRQEYDAWQLALRVADELKAKKEAKLTDPLLALLDDFRKDNQLDAALLLLTFKEAYRPDFEQWKKDHPDGVVKFVQAFNVRP